MRRGRRGGNDAASGKDSFEAVYPLEEGSRGGVGRWAGHAHDRHLEADPGVEGVAHLHQCPADDLHRPHDGGVAHPPGLAGDPGDLLGGEGEERRSTFGGEQGGEEGVTKVLDEFGTDAPGVAALHEPLGDGGQGVGCIPLAQRLDDQVDGVVGIERLAARCDLIKSGECVTGGAAPLADDPVEGSFADIDTCRLADHAQKPRKGLPTQKLEFVVLCAGPDGRQHLLRVGGGEDEYDVARRFFQRLQQRVRGARAQHVDLVDDVDLPSPGARNRHPSNEVAHRVDAAVGGGVEFVDVEARPEADPFARGAVVARLPVLGLFEAVERLGQDAGGGGLTRATRS